MILRISENVWMSVAILYKTSNKTTTIYSFYGTVGTGKSFLSGCIASELLQTGHSVIYFSASGLFDTLARYAFDSRAKEALSGFYEDLYNCDLLIIDDLGTEMTNTFCSLPAVLLSE